MDCGLLNRIFSVSLISGGVLNINTEWDKASLSFPFVPENIQTPVLLLWLVVICDRLSPVIFIWHLYGH